MSLISEISNIEQNYFVNNAYDERVQRYFSVTDAINRILDEYSDGMIYDIHACTLEGNILYSNLSTANQEKIINLGPRDSSYDRLEKARDILRYTRRKGCSYILHPGCYYSYQKSDEEYISKLCAVLHRCKIIDLNAELKARGYEIKSTWYDDYGVSYSNIHDAMASYDELEEAENRKREVVEKLAECAKRCWAYYFFIRDFYSANIWFDKYIMHEQDESSRNDARECWNLVGGVLRKYENTCMASDNIVINWVDALPYGDLKYMSFLEERTRGGVFFKNIYTQTPNTHPTFKYIFNQLSLIEDHNYTFSEEIFYEGEFANWLNEKGFRLVSVGPYHFKHRNGHRFLYQRGTSLGIPTSLVLFDAAHQMADRGGGRQLILVHSGLKESHGPNISPKYPETDELEFGIMETRTRYAQKYLDYQLEFYDKFLTGSSLCVYLSDHGNGKGLGGRFDIESTYHTMLSMVGKNVPSVTVDRLGSLRSFTSIFKTVFGYINDRMSIDQLIDAVNKELDGYAIIEVEDPYNIVNRIIEKGSYDVLSLQHRGIVTQEDAYIRSVLGDEYYFRQGDSSVNLIDMESPESNTEGYDYSDRIDTLRNKTGVSFIDIYRHRRYKGTRRMYRKLNIRRSASNKYI